MRYLSVYGATKITLEYFINAFRAEADIARLMWSPFEYASSDSGRRERLANSRPLPYQSGGVRRCYSRSTLRASHGL
jgi:hypothetical protein